MFQRALTRLCLVLVGVLVTVACADGPPDPGGAAPAAAVPVVAPADASADAAGRARPATSRDAVPRAQRRNCAARPSRCGYPDATNTGVPGGTTLRSSGPIDADRNGMVIDGRDVRGEINVTASNVTIKNTRVTGGRGIGPADWVIIIRPGADNLRIIDSTILTPAGTPQDIACIFNIGESKPWIQRVDISGCSAGVSTGGGTVRDSYIHDMAEVEGLSHDVGIASNGGGGLQVRHNTIFNQLDQTAAVAMYQDFGGQRDNVVRRNLLAGGGYCVYGGAGDTATRNIKFIRNRFSRRYHSRCGYYGVVASFDRNDPGNVWRENFWDDTLRPAR
ncbi:hypothetical protein [Nocardioides sp. 1609]|uniref:hypothetical protein n=1 Tax=Nocardioides sp. 1609 TaxID=2508327 RepID=UPI00106FA8D2|nr:hypothetical protein [Nocardioides sp. 1609]